MSGNSLTNPPAEILRMGFGHIMSYIRFLNKGAKSKVMELVQVALEFVPPSVVAMTNLTSLSLKGNVSACCDCMHV